MADEMEGNSPRSTSEATPPPVDSPEMVSQPSPPEEQRVSSSTDRQPPEVAIPDEQRIGSTSRRGPNEGAGPSRRLSALERLLLSSDEAGAVEGSSGVLIQSSSEATPAIDNQSTVGRVLIDAGLVRAAIESALVQATLRAAQMRENTGGQIESSEEIAKEVINRSGDEEKSDDSNQQFDVDDSSSVSKSSPENVDLGSDSSPLGSDVHGDEQTSPKRSVTEKVGAGSDLSPIIGAAIEEKSSLGIGATETVGSESQLLSSKAGPAMPVSGSSVTENSAIRSDFSPSKSGPAILVSASGSTDNTGLKGELSPSKAGALSVEGSCSTPGTAGKGRDAFISPKRKSPSKFHHLSPKRSALSPDKLQCKSDSHMSTLLDELYIKSMENKPGISEPFSRHEQETSTEMEETDESQEEEQGMEVHETDDSRENEEEQ